MRKKLICHLGELIVMLVMAIVVNLVTGSWIATLLIIIFCVWGRIEWYKFGKTFNPTATIFNKGFNSADSRDETLNERKRTEWDLELLNKLEWKRFEEVVSEYYRLIGYRSEVTRMGADGGVDVLLYQHGAETPAIIVQCKAWSKKVGVNAVRELYGVMAADGVGYGIFATTSDYTNEAQEWVVGKSMQLLSGSNLVTMFNQLADDQRKEHLMNGLLGDYSTPTCPNCDQKMVRRTASKGKSVGSSFWGCINYPRCKLTFKMV
jgi:restriction system protein